jgi:hypothetical protein
MEVSSLPRPYSTPLRGTAFSSLHESFAITLEKCKKQANNQMLNVPHILAHKAKELSTRPSEMQKQFACTYDKV